MHLVLDLLRIQVAELCDYLLTLLFDFHQLGLLLLDCLVLLHML